MNDLVEDRLLPGFVAEVNVILADDKSEPPLSGEIYRVTETLNSDLPELVEHNQTVAVLSPWFIGEGRSLDYFYISATDKKIIKRYPLGATVVLMSLRPSDNKGYVGIIGRVVPREIAAWVVARRMVEMRCDIQKAVDKLKTVDKFKEKMHRFLKLVKVLK